MIVRMKVRDRLYQNHYGIDLKNSLFGFYKYIYIYIYVYIYVYDISMSIIFFEISAPYKSESWIRHWSYTATVLCYNLSSRIPEFEEGYLK